MNWFSVVLFMAGWLTTLSGVAMGGWLVFRACGGSNEKLFRFGEAKGESFNIDGDMEQVEDVVGTTLPKPTEDTNEVFLNQFADIVAKKGGSNA